MASPVDSPRNREAKKRPVPSAGNGPYRRGRNSLRKRVGAFFTVRVVHFVLIAVAATAISYGSHLEQFRLSERIDKIALDHYFDVRPAPSAADIRTWPNTKDIILIETPHQLPRPLLSRLLYHLRYAKVVAFDLMFVNNEAQLLPEEKGLFQHEIAGWRSDTAIFANAVRRHGHVALGTWPEQRDTSASGMTPQIKVNGSESSLNWDDAAQGLHWEKPPPVLWNSARYHGHLNVTPDVQDNVVRQVLLFKDTSAQPGVDKPEMTPCLGLAIAAAASGLTPEEIRKLQVQNGLLKLGNHTVSVGADENMTIDYVGDRSTFEALDNHNIYTKVLDGTYDDEEFKDKIVLVGEVSLKSKEIFETPMGEMPGMQIHAHIAATLLSRLGAPLPLGPAAIVAISFLFCLLLIAPLGRWPLWTSFLTALILVAVTFVLGAAIFTGWHQILPAGVPVFAVILATACIALYEYWHVRQTLARFIGQEMVQPTLQTFMQLKLGGRREEATAFFCDLRGYSGLTERMELSELTAIMNEYTDLLAQVVHRFGGRIIDFQGDGAFCLFEKRFAGKNYALKGTQAALEMRREFELLRAEWGGPAAESVDVGIGLDTGEMMIGNVGATSHMKLGAIGDVVNVAARVQRLSRECGYNVLITRHTYDYVSEHMTAEPCGTIVVHGRNQGVEIFGVGEPIAGGASPPVEAADTLVAAVEDASSKLVNR